MSCTNLPVTNTAYLVGFGCLRKTVFSKHQQLYCRVVMCSIANGILFTADVASVSATSVPTKKKKDDKETSHSAVRARYLMEKYGTRWRAKVAAGVYWSFYTRSFHKTTESEAGSIRQGTCALLIGTTVLSFPDIKILIVKFLLSIGAYLLEEQCF